MGYIRYGFYDMLLFQAGIFWRVSPARKLHAIAGRTVTGPPISEVSPARRDDVSSATVNAILSLTSGSTRSHSQVQQKTAISRGTFFVEE